MLKMYSFKGNCIIDTHILLSSWFLEELLLGGLYFISGVSRTGGLVYLHLLITELIDLQHSYHLYHSIATTYSSIAFVSMESGSHILFPEKRLWEKIFLLEEKVKLKLELKLKKIEKIVKNKRVLWVERRRESLEFSNFRHIIDFFNWSNLFFLVEPTRTLLVSSCLSIHAISLVALISLISSDDKGRKN